MPEWESHIDKQIRQAMEEGEFTNLPGEGQPLKLDEDEFTPEHLQMAFKILRENDLAPEWIMIGKDLEASHARLMRNIKRAVYAYQAALKDPIRGVQADSTWKAARQNLSDETASLNRDITIYNLKVPPGVRHRPLVNLQHELKALMG